MFNDPMTNLPATSTQLKVLPPVAFVIQSLRNVVTASLWSNRVLQEVLEKELQLLQRNCEITTLLESLPQFPRPPAAFCHSHPSTVYACKESCSTCLTRQSVQEQQKKDSPTGHGCETHRAPELVPTASQSPGQLPAREGRNASSVKQRHRCDRPFLPALENVPIANCSCSKAKSTEVPRHTNELESNDNWFTLVQCRKPKSREVCSKFASLNVFDVLQPKEAQRTPGNLRLPAGAPTPSRRNQTRLRVNKHGTGAAQRTAMNCHQSNKQASTKKYPRQYRMKKGAPFCRSVPRCKIRIIHHGRLSSPSSKWNLPVTIPSTPIPIPEPEESVAR